MSNSIISKTTRLASPASDDSMRPSTSTSTLGLKGLINGSIGIIIWMNGLINGSIGYYYMDECIFQFSYIHVINNVAMAIYV